MFGDISFCRLMPIVAAGDDRDRDKERFIDEGNSGGTTPGGGDVTHQNFASNMASMSSGGGTSGDLRHDRDGGAAADGPPDAGQYSYYFLSIRVRGQKRKYLLRSIPIAVCCYQCVKTYLLYESCWHFFSFLSHSKVESACMFCLGEG